MADQTNAPSSVAQRVGGFFGEFWKFAAKGNAIQLAVAVVLGTSFSAIVNALVNNIITPFISLATNNVDFNSLSYTVRPTIVLNGTTTPALVVGYGTLIQAVINFFIVGLSIFVVYKLVSGGVARLQRKEEEEQKAAPPDPVSTQEKLLSEIRDLLKEQAETQK